ncbi:MAG: Fic family protein [Lactobacillales bacterium]|nr:Fic family protein [Lactobacillales bacterium]
MCEKFNEAISRNEIEPLILISVFVFDFLCIHPFNDGNGKISRLLTLLLFYRIGYIIEKSKDTYYEALQTSSFD